MKDWITSLVDSWWYPERAFLARPVATWELHWWYAGVTIACLVGAIVLVFAKKLHPVLRQHLSNAWWTNAILGGILYFARDQRIPYFGTDIVRTVQLFSLFVWTVVAVWIGVRAARFDNKASLLTERRERYLPKNQKLTS